MAESLIPYAFQTEHQRKTATYANIASKRYPNNLDKFLREFCFLIEPNTKGITLTNDYFKRKPQEGLVDLMLRYERSIPLLFNNNHWAETATQLVDIHETNTNARLEFLRAAEMSRDTDLFSIAESIDRLCKLGSLTCHDESICYNKISALSRDSKNVRFQ